MDVITPAHPFFLMVLRSQINAGALERAKRGEPVTLVDPPFEAHLSWHFACLIRHPPKGGDPADLGNVQAALADVERAMAA